MPRTFSTAVTGEVAKQFGSEPLVVVGVEWTAGEEVLYSDQKLNGAEYPYPILVEVGNFDSTTIINGSGDSQTVSVTLSDLDGTLKQILQTYDVHLSRVRIYLSFQGLAVDDRALMFEGLINSPIIWDEGSRTLTFDVLSVIEGVEVGFTMDDGDFPFVPPPQRNTPWPLVFGQVCNMEAVRVSTLLKGTLVEGVGVKDPTLDERLCQANNLLCETNTDPGQGVQSNREDPQCVARRFNEICSLLHRIEEEQQYVRNTFTVLGGTRFPQNQKITIQIGDVRFDGIMVGETFNVSQVYHPDLERIDNPPCREFSGAAIGWRAGAGNGGLPETTGPAGSGPTSCADVGPPTKDIVEGAGESWRYYNTFQEGDFIWLPPGSDVVLADDADLLYIVSLIPGTVDQVAAYRTFGDVALLTEVSTDRYTVHTENYGEYTVNEIRMQQPLSSIVDEDWDDDLYVSFTSSVGPNPMDVILWLLTKYTDLTVDATSWAAVRSDLTNYPANFWVKERPNVFDLIRDIAYQFRCAAFIRDRVVYFVYLSKEPTSLKTLTESDILSNTLRISHSLTEDLITKHAINWREGEAGIFRDEETELSFTLKLNIPTYGVVEKGYDYYTQNTYSTIEKSATFWMIRQANTWQYVEFETPIKHLNLDIFDAFTLDIEQFPTTKCVVVESQYNVDANTVRFKCWTPILGGTDTPYMWAWPALQSATAVFEGDFGDNTSDGVTPPEGHPLRAGYDPETARLATAGDRRPSDLDDVFPTVTCKVATGAEIADTVEPVLRPFEPLAEENFAARQDGIAAGGTPDDDENKEDGPDACGQPVSEGLCAFEVRIQYVTPITITTVSTGLKGVDCKDGAPCRGINDAGGDGDGMPCHGILETKCHRFGNANDASAFASAKRQEADNLKANCGYHNGVEAPWLVLGITDVSNPARRDSNGNLVPCGTGVDCICEGTPPESQEITQPGIEHVQDA